MATNPVVVPVIPLSERIDLCNSRLLQERVAQAVAESGKAVDVTKAVAAVVLSVNGLPTDDEIVAYVAGL